MFALTIFLGLAFPVRPSDDRAKPRILVAEDLKALAWRSVGPANMGGRVADIALAPNNAKTFSLAASISDTPNFDTVLK